MLFKVSDLELNCEPATTWYVPGELVNYMQHMHNMEQGAATNKWARPLRHVYIRK